MALGTHIKRNSVFAFLSQAIRLLTNAVVFVGIARLYGPVEFGRFTAAHTLSVVFLLVADFGFDALLTWEVARARHRTTELASTYLSAKILSSCVALVAMLIIAQLSARSVQTRVVMDIFAVYTLVSTIGNFFFALFKGLEQFHHETRISFVGNLLLLVLVFWLGFLGAPLFTIALAFILSRLVMLLLSVRVGRGVWSVKSWRFALPGKESVRLIAIFGANQVLGALFFVQDTLLLSMWRGEQDVGLYQAVFKIVTFLFIVPDVLYNTFLPSLSRLYVEDRGRWEVIARLLNKTLTFIGLPVALVMLFFADTIIHLLYGQGTFDAAIPLVELFAGVVVFHFSGITHAIILLTANRPGTRMGALVLLTVFNAGVNAFMIPRYGPWGAAITALATMALAATCYIGLAWKYCSRRIFDTGSLLAFPAIAAAGVILWLVGPAFKWVTLVPLLLLYTSALWWRGYTSEERTLLTAREGGRFALLHLPRQISSESEIDG
jgi:O-antigen/teichoic acid export membrane protein